MARNPLIEAIHAARYDLETCARHERAACRVDTAAFDRGELNREFVGVVRYQGPRANGMPELHKLTPLLGATKIMFCGKMLLMKGGTGPLV